MYCALKPLPMSSTADHTINTGNALTVNACNYPFNYRVLAVFSGLSLSQCALVRFVYNGSEMNGKKMAKWRNDISPMHVIWSASSIVPCASCFRNSMCFPIVFFFSLNDSALHAITVTHIDCAQAVGMWHKWPSEAIVKFKSFECLLAAEKPCVLYWENRKLIATLTINASTLVARYAPCVCAEHLWTMSVHQILVFTWAI